MHGAVTMKHQPDSLSMDQRWTVRNVDTDKYI